MIYVYRILILFGLFIVGYIFGSIPNGIIIGKIFYKKDPRNYGSHNTGGTNVGRSFSKVAGAATIVLDALKLMIPYLGAYYLFKYYTPICTLMDSVYDSSNLVYNWYGFGNSLIQLAIALVPFGAMIGHSSSIFLKFKGGKIVACFVGYMLLSTYLAVPLFILVFFIVLFKTKYVSLSSIIMSASFMVYSWIVYIIYVSTGSQQIASYLMWFNLTPSISIFFPILSTFGALLLIFRHRENIKRLKNGTESKVKWVDQLIQK